MENTYAIQWFDPYDLTAAGRARKDGKPRGSFVSKKAAEDAAENACAVGGGDIPYKIVEIEHSA